MTYTRLIATSNKANRLLFPNYVGRIRLEELASPRAEINALSADLLPRFRLPPHPESWEVVAFCAQRDRFARVAGLAADGAVRAI